MAENKWVTGVITFITLLIGVITPFIIDRGPPCRGLIFLNHRGQLGTGIVYHFWQAFCSFLLSSESGNGT